MMHKKLMIIIKDSPIPKKRPRFRRVGKHVQTYNVQAKEEELFRIKVMEQVGMIAPLKGPLQVDCAFFIPRPKSHYRTGKNSHLLKKSAPIFHTSTPDKDNLEKFVFDALNKYLWKDDSQIVCGYSDKRYSDYPATMITVKQF